MKKLQLLLGVLLFTLSAFADSYPVKFGPNEKGSRYSGIRLLGKYQESVLVFRSNIGNTKLIKFDTHLSQELETKIDFKLDGKTRAYNSVSMFNDKIILFTSYRDKKTKVKTLYYDVYSAKTLKRTSKGKELVSYQSNSKMFKSKGGFKIYFSEDKTKMGVIVFLPYDKKAKQKFKAIVFDEDFNQISATDYELPVLDSKMSMGSAHISNKGLFYISATEYLGEKKIFKPSETKRHIYKLDVENGIVDNVMKLNGKYIYSYTFKTNELNDLILSGYYTQKGFRGIVGAFYLRIDSEDGDIVVENSEAFPNDFITQGWSNRLKKKTTKKKKQPVLYSYRLKKLITTDDGGALMVAEQYYTVTRTYTSSNGAQRTVTYYYYNDIIISRLNVDGEFLWNKKVRKYQVSTNDGGYYSSFAFHFDKDNIYIMYNDNIKNYDESGKPVSVDSRIAPTNLASNKKNVTSMVTIGINSGELKKEQLFNKKETGTIAVPKIHFSSKEEDRLYFYTKKGKNERIGFVTFQ